MAAQEGSGARGQQVLRDAYERTTDLLGLMVAGGCSTHEALMLAFCRGRDRAHADLRAVDSEHTVEATS